MNTLLTKLVISVTISCVMVNSCDIPKSNFSQLKMQKLIGPWLMNSVSPTTFPNEYSCWTNLFYKDKGNYYANASLYVTSVGSFVNMTASLVAENKNIIDVTFFGPPDWNYGYQVQATDYKNYIILSGCPKAMEAMGGYIIWISYRTWCPEQSTIDAAMAALKEAGLGCYDYANACTNNTEKCV